MKISQKLWLNMALMLLALTLLAGISHYTNERSQAYKQQLAVKTETLLAINQVDADITTMLLSAMDIIVDKDSGKPDPILVEDVASAHKAATATLTTLSQAADISASLKSNLEAAAAHINHVHGSITSQLYAAVEQGAAPEEFAKLDDSIDSEGSAAKQLLQVAHHEVSESFTATRLESDQSIEHAEQLNQIIFALSLSLAIAAAVYIVRSIGNPLRGLVRDINAIASGDSDIAIEALGRRDEIGAIATSLDAMRQKVEEAFRLKRMVDDMPINIMTADIRNDFKINYTNNATKQTIRAIQQYISLPSGVLEGQSIDIFHKDPQRVRQLLSNPANLPHQAKIAVGPETLNLKVSAVTNHKGEYICAMLTWDIVTQTVRLANDFENSVGAVSHQLGSSATALQERATSLHSAIEELSVAALEISKRVNDSLDIVRQAVETGNNAGAMTDQLSTSAEKISNVVTLIRSIAEKTNLLALNATIESARAGDAGKGFAVVANEVKTLASQTANAIGEITKQISEMQDAARGTADAISQMSGVIKNISVISNTIAGTVEQQQAATDEIARNISGGSAHQSLEALTIMGMATQLTDASHHLQNQCETFLQRVRSM